MAGENRVRRHVVVTRHFADANVIDGADGVGLVCQEGFLQLPPLSRALPRLLANYGCPQVLVIPRSSLEVPTSPSMPISPSVSISLLVQTSPSVQLSQIFLSVQISPSVQIPLSVLIPLSAQSSPLAGAELVDYLLAPPHATFSFKKHNGRSSRCWFWASGADSKDPILRHK